jgi:hypothetical protein
MCHMRRRIHVASSSYDTHANHLSKYKCVLFSCLCMCAHAHVLNEQTLTHKHTRTQHTQQQQKVILPHKRIMHGPRDDLCIFFNLFSQKKK